MSSNDTDRTERTSQRTHRAQLHRATPRSSGSRTWEQNHSASGTRLSTLGTRPGMEGLTRRPTKHSKRASEDVQVYMSTVDARLARIESALVGLSDLRDVVQDIQRQVRLVRASSPTEENGTSRMARPHAFSPALGQEK